MNRENLNIWQHFSEIFLIIQDTYRSDLSAYLKKTKVLIHKI